MFDRYGIYNLHEENDALLILLSNEEVTNRKLSKEVEVLYHQDKVIGYKIPNFIRYAKIKYSGIIFLPNNYLIDVINSVLINSGLEPINYRKNSGFVVKTNEKGQKMVWANEGTFLRDMTPSEGKFVTYYDLYIKNEKEDELITIEEDILEGKDFFKMEEK